jgi:hypothetical protein
MDDVILHVAIPIIMLLLGWIMKQNRDSRIDMRQALEVLSLAVSDAKEGLQEYRESWMDRRESTLDLMLTQCEQRRSACCNLWQTKIKQLDDKTDAACMKIVDAQKKFARKWEKQEKVNHTTSVYQTEASIKWKRIDEHMKRLNEHLMDKRLHNTN